MRRAISRGGRSAGRTLSDLLGDLCTLLPGAKGSDPEEARDLTAGFFQLLLTRRDLDASPQGERTTALLSTGILQHFLGGERRREMTIKRGYGQWLIRWKSCTRLSAADLPAVDSLIH